MQIRDWLPQEWWTSVVLVSSITFCQQNSAYCLSFRSANQANNLFIWNQRPRLRRPSYFNNITSNNWLQWCAWILGIWKCLGSIVRFFDKWRSEREAQTKCPHLCHVIQKILCQNWGGTNVLSSLNGIELLWGPEMSLGNSKGLWKGNQFNLSNLSMTSL